MLREQESYDEPASSSVSCCSVPNLSNNLGSQQSGSVASQANGSGNVALKNDYLKLEYKQAPKKPRTNSQSSLLSS